MSQVVKLKSKTKHGLKQKQVHRSGMMYFAAFLIVLGFFFIVNSGSMGDAIGGGRAIEGMIAAGDSPALSDEMQRVRHYIANRYRVSPEVLETALQSAEKSGRKHGVDPMLLVAMMAIESSFDPHAQSHVGAQGLMQVIPRYHREKIGKNAGARALFDPELNVDVGAQVLREALNRHGSLQRALQYYNGALNDPSAKYAKRVFAMKSRLAVASADLRQNNAA